MIEHQLWADVCKLALGGVAFVLCGDFSQFPACCECHVGRIVPEGALGQSHMIRDLSGGNILTLTENRRSDQILFDFYTSLSGRPLAEALQEARIRFPVTSRPATTIVISHARRRFLNMRRNLAEKVPDAVFYRAQVTGKAGPQSMWLWPGLAVVGAGGGCQKGHLRYDHTRHLRGSCVAQRYAARGAPGGEIVALGVGSNVPVGTGSDDTWRRALGLHELAAFHNSAPVRW